MESIRRQGSWAAAAALALLGAVGCGGAADEVVGAAPAATRVANPFDGVSGYVNPEWRAHALTEIGGDRVASTPTAIWLDSIGAVKGAGGRTSLQQHLDNALAQGAGYIQVVLYDLPGRDCRGRVQDGELGPSELSRYQSEFIDPIVAIEADAKYAGLRIVNVIEPRSLGYTISGGLETACATVVQNGAYVGGIQYALGKLGAIPNVYNYVDIASHLWLGWTDNMPRGAEVIAKAILGAPGGVSTVAGFVSNVGQYAATVEPYFQASTMVGGRSVKESKWVDWANYVDEQGYVLAMREALVARGMSDGIGMLIDTSRNGWGGTSRPTQASQSTNVDTFVDASRVDRRLFPENDCNQKGAGLGARPGVTGIAGIHAYTWIKPPGESDGTSTMSEPLADFMCDPNGNGTRYSGRNAPTGALPNAPAKGAWFSTQFQELMANAYPPLAPVSDTLPPSTPWNLKASNVSSISLMLSWSASTDNVAVVAYDVYSSATLVTSVQTTSATVQGLVSGTTYTFTVRSRDAAGNVSTPSQPLTVAGTCCGTPNPPSVPTNVAYSNVTYTSLTLSWTASTDEIGIDWYEVLDGGVMIGSSESTQYDVTGLFPGTSHTFTVRAVSTRSMNSDASSPVTVTTRSITVPSAPGNLRWAVSEGTVTLCWDAPADWNDGYGYHLLYGSLNLGLFTDTCVALIGFKPGTPYTFTVKTVDAAGNASVASNSVTVLLEIPKDTTPPTAPSNLTWSLLSSTSARLTWTASKDDVGVVLYQIYLSGALLQTVAASTSAMVTGLAADQTYVFTVKAVDAAGNVSSPSNSATVITVIVEPGEPPGPPTNVHVTGVTATSVSLAWTAGTDDVGVVLYQVIAGGAVVATSSGTSAIVSNLTTGAAYTFTVKSVDVAGNVSVASDPVGAMSGVGPIDPQIPAAPTNLRVTSEGMNGALMLSWDPSTGSVPAVAYKVYSELGLVRTTTLTQMAITGYGSGSSHTFTVRAVDAAADLSTASASVTVKIPERGDTVSPSNPTNLKATATTATSVSLIWTAATDDWGMAGYDIYTDGVLVGISRATTATISGLSARSYTFNVRSRDTAGNVSVGAEVTVTPGTSIDPVDPAVPGNLRVATDELGAAAILSWDPPTSGGAVTGYQLYKRIGQTDYLEQSTAITSGIVAVPGGGVATYYVKALHGSGSASAASALVTIIFLDNGDPVRLEPIPLKATATTSTTATLSWSPTSSPCSLWYRVYADDVLVELTAGTTATISNLTAGKSYVFQVYATDGCAQSAGPAWSITVKPGATLDTTPPSTPANLNVSTGTGSSTRIFTWSAVTDNVGVVGYDLYCQTSWSTWTYLAASSTTTTATTTGTDRSWAVCWVRARDAVGNSSSASSSVTVP